MIQRSTWLASALGGTVLATGWATWQAPDTAPPVVAAVVRSPGTGAGTRPADATASAPSPPGRGSSDDASVRAATTADPDAGSRRRAWAPLAPDVQAAWGAPTAAPPDPAPQPRPEAAAARPEAPAFPYAWIGGMDDAEGGRIVFLGGPRRTLAVRAGDIVDGVWRVDLATAEGPPTFTWLPDGPAAHPEPRP